MGAIWIKSFAGATSEISKVFSKSSSSDAKKIGTIIVKIISKIEDALTSSSESSYDYSSLISAMVTSFSSQLTEVDKIDQGMLITNTVKAVSDEINMVAEKKSTSVMVMNSVLTSISKAFMMSSETTLKVANFMKTSMMKIKETYEAYTKDDELAVNLIANTVNAMNDKLNSDKAIMRAMLFSEVIETVSKTFKSAFSTSTTNWLGMMSSSATKISEAFGTISSAFNKEAGTMVVKVSLAIKDEFESSSTSSTFQSGNLMS